MRGLKALRIEGRLESFERIRRETGWIVAVAFSLRADLASGGEPLLLREYAVEVPANGESVRDSVAAFGTALDQLYAEFVRDLTAAVARG